MPLFSYVCDACECTSEVLTRNGEKPECPECGSKKMAKELSHFAPLSASPEASMPACDMGNMCCGGGCGVPQN